MQTHIHFSTACLAVAVAAGLVAATQRAAALQQLENHLPPAVTRLQPKGVMARSEHLHLAIGLPLRDQAGVSNLFAAIYDPTSPEFHRYLTYEQFTERFGPSEDDYQAVQDYLSANGLTVTATHANRVVLEVEGPVASVEKALHVRMQVYDHPTEARTFYAPDREPSLDLAVPVLHVSGLENFRLTRPRVKPIDPSTARDDNANPRGGSGPGGTLLGNDFRKAYLPGVTSLTGAGQSVGLLQFQGFIAKDMTNYANAAGISVPPIITVPINGGITNPDGGTEVSLDIEMVMAMAPSATIYVYETHDGSLAGWDALLSGMVSNTACKQFSCSYGGPGPNPTAENLFIQMGMQGQTFFDASGDSDSFLSSTDSSWPGFPTDSPNIVQVGGTTLTLTNGVYFSEKVWNYATPTTTGDGSSGGYGTDMPTPSYQAGISNAANLASTRYRNVPDVSLTADNIFIYDMNGGSGGVGGTSCAAPLWAGFMANVNQEAARLGKPPPGFINPAVYALGQGSTYAGSFHDITTGNNEWLNHPTNFVAVTGYDLATGWGTPVGMHTINALIGLDSPVGLLGDVWVNVSSPCPALNLPDCTSGVGPATSIANGLSFVGGPNGGTLFLTGTGHSSRIAQSVGIRAFNGPARIQP